MCECSHGVRNSGSHRVITIDPPGSMDLDDALSIRVLPSGLLELGVHIADPTHFVREGTGAQWCDLGRMHVV